MPEGKKCIIFVSSQKTVLRDKNGYVLKRINSLLPNGHKGAKEKGKSILQGVCYEREKVVYATDVIMWNGELLIDSVAEYRLFLLQGIIGDNSIIGTHLNEQNELMFRIPAIYSCTTEGLQRVYYGCSNESELSNLLAYAVKVLNTSPDILNKETAQQFAAHFAYDNTKSPYLKDGIAFVRREGELSFGYSSDYLIWRDKLVSPYFDSLVSFPFIATLRCVGKNTFRTQEGCEVKYESEEEFTPESVYAFSYEGIEIAGHTASLSGMKLVKKMASKIFVSTVSQLVFKCVASTLSFEKILQEAGASAMVD